MVIHYASVNNSDNVYYTLTGNGSWIYPPEISKHKMKSQYQESRNMLFKYDSHMNMLHGSYDAEDKNLWLFNIRDDPNEHVDMSAKYPSIVKELLYKLSNYNSIAVPPRYPPPDPRCNPSLLGGAWGPWE